MIETLPEELIHHLLGFMTPVNQVVFLCVRSQADHLLADLADSLGVAVSAAVSDFVYYNRHELVPSDVDFYCELSGH